MAVLVSSQTTYTVCERITPQSYEVKGIGIDNILGQMHIYKYKDIDREIEISGGKRRRETNVSFGGVKSGDFNENVLGLEGDLGNITIDNRRQRQN